MELFAVIISVVSLVLTVGLMMHVDAKSVKDENKFENRIEFVNRRFSDFNYQIELLRNHIRFIEARPIIEEYCKLKYPNKKTSLSHSGGNVGIYADELLWVESFNTDLAQQKLTELKSIIETVCCKKGQE